MVTKQHEYGNAFWKKQVFYPQTQRGHDTECLLNILYCAVWDDYED